MNSKENLDSKITQQVDSTESPNDFNLEIVVNKRYLHLELYWRRKMIVPVVQKIVPVYFYSLASMIYIKENKN